MDPAIRQRLDEFIAAKGLRHTTQRDAIVEAAFGTTEHYTAEDLLTMARKIEKSVSRATVYRTLPLLVESGLLKEMDFGKEHKFYDPNFIEHPHHNHLICVDCDRIVEFEDERIDRLEENIVHRLGFSSESKMIRIEARCDRLKASGACKNRSKSG
jgi:Fur family ferric uptake transcriptional regulator